MQTLVPTYPRVTYLSLLLFAVWVAKVSAAGYSRKICSAACQLLDLQLNRCDNALRLDDWTGLLIRLCPGLIVFVAGRLGVRNDLLDGNWNLQWNPIPMLAKSLCVYAHVLAITG